MLQSLLILLMFVFLIKHLIKSFSLINNQKKRVKGGNERYLNFFFERIFPNLNQINDKSCQIALLRVISEISSGLSLPSIKLFLSPLYKSLFVLFCFYYLYYYFRYLFDVIIIYIFFRRICKIIIITIK